MADLQVMHPNPEQLLAFGLGRLDECESLAIADHLADCPKCRTALETLPEDDFVAKVRNSARMAATGPACEESQRGGEAPTRADVGSTAPEWSEVPPELAHHPRYRLLQVLGVGGMGTVFKAEHQLMERPVALKVIRRDLTGNPAAVERFRREVKS